MLDTKSAILDVPLPHIPEQCDSESKAIRVVNHILTVLAFLDKNLKLNKLPRYVSDSPDAVRLYEGDLASLM